MSETTKKAGLWTALGAAVVGLVASRPEVLVNILTEHAGVLVAFSCAAVLSVAIPHKLKALLPSGKWVPLMSAAVCIGTYIAARAAWVMKAGEIYTPPDLVIDSIVGVTLAVLVPILYECCLPKKLRERWSYTSQVQKRRVKGVMTPAGTVEERPADQVSGEGEETVIQAYDRTEIAEIDIGDPTEPREGGGS